MTRQIQVLLVEDNPGDADLITDALEADKIRIHLSLVEDGQAALDYLRRVPPYADAPRPDLILLDINLPKLDGRDVLVQIKQDEDLRQIPVVMLTSSDNKEDVASCYGLGANCYLTKPVGLAEFQAIVQAIDHFWLSIVKLP
jgi:CheY-like chemotaxis protein